MTDQKCPVCAAPYPSTGASKSHLSVASEAFLTIQDSMFMEAVNGSRTESELEDMASQFVLLWKHVVLLNRSAEEPLSTVVRDAPQN